MQHNAAIEACLQSAASVLATLIAFAFNSAMLVADDPAPRSNQEVAQAIATELAIDGFAEHEIEVRYRDGKVRLTGTVETEEQIDRATKLVRAAAPNVWLIDNRLVSGAVPVVSPGPSAPNSGDQTSDSGGTLNTGTPNPSTEKRQQRNTIVLAMLVAGIALTGLLLLIAAIAVRGFLRKMARQSEEKRRAELTLPPDVAAAAAEAASAGDVDESVPFSERETEVT